MKHLFLGFLVVLLGGGMYWGLNRRQTNLAQIPALDPQTAQEGVQLFQKSGCGRCHKLGASEPPPVVGLRPGPDLTAVGARLSKEKIQESILDPDAEIPEPRDKFSVEGRSTMPSYKEQLGPEQVKLLTEFLFHQRTVTPSPH